MKIYSASQSKKYLSPVPFGYKFEYAGKTNYTTDDGSQPIPEEWVKEIIDDLDTRYPVKWLDIAIFLMPYTLRFYNNGVWGMKYEGETHYTHIVLSGQYRLNKADVACTVTHEIGHAIQQRLTEEQWKQYLKLRNLKNTKRSMWEDRPKEIFAEDFRYLFGSELAKRCKFMTYDEPDDPRPPGEETKEFFRSVQHTEEVASGMRRFKSYTVEEIKEFLEKFYFTRPITQIHIHHTWRPEKKDYRGEETIRGMWRYHTQVRGQSDISQHFTVAPDGTIWDGRDLNRDPASIKGHNKGAICIEIIGNFDKESLEGKQREAVIQLVLALLDVTSLTTDDIIFHREYSSKTCPGMNIDKSEFIGWIEAWRRFNGKGESMIGKKVQGVAPVLLNGKQLNKKAIIIDGVSYLPVRELAETLGLSVDWDGRVILKKGD